MNDVFEKKFKEFLPYIIIIGVIYLFFPIFLVISGNNGGSTVFNQITYLGIFPLTALLCCLHYSFKKKNDFFLSLVAPILFIPSMLLYGNIRDSVLNCIIFIVSYFICGYLGLLIGEMLAPKKKVKEENAVESSSGRRARTPKRVSQKAVEETKEHFESQNVSDIEIEEPYTTTAEDIDSILEEIHARHESENE